MNQKYIFLKLDDKSIFLKYINNANIKSYYPIKKINILLKIFIKLKLTKFIFCRDWKKKICDYNLVILGENGYSFEISKYIKKVNPNCKIILYYWNYINYDRFYK